MAGLILQRNVTESDNEVEDKFSGNNGFDVYPFYKWSQTVRNASHIIKLLTEVLKAMLPKRPQHH